jgi:ribonuclease BN (tRNA processing enzyme)
MGVGLDEIDGVFISHLHADHVGGLEELTFRMKFIHGRKLKLFLPEALTGLIWEQTLRGGLENIEEGMTGLEDYYDVVPLMAGTPHEIVPGFTVEVLPTRHIPHKPSFALIVNGGLYYSTDSRFDLERLTDLVERRNCKYILHDCQLFDPGTVHATLSELLTLSDVVQKRILLMHYGDDMESFIGRTGNMTFMRQQELYEFEISG